MIPRQAPPLLAFLAAACSREATPTLHFTDVTREAGVSFHLTTGASGERFLLETMTGGTAWIDQDQDGDWDLFCVNGHGDPLQASSEGREGDQLFRNDGKGRFTDDSDRAGVGDRRYGFGAAVGDLDNDGSDDLLVTNFGRNTLYRNRGGGTGTFEDITVQAGLVETGWSTSAADFDMEGDGDLDIFVVRYLAYDPATSRHCTEKGQPVYCHPRLFPGQPDLLYENLGSGRFREVGRAAGIARGGEAEGKGLGVLALDLDRDGTMEVYVANDTTPNFLWKRGESGKYRDIAQEAGVALGAEGQPHASMGVDAADLNSDGLPDIYVTSFASELNDLYLSLGSGLYANGTSAANLAGSYLPLGFGTLLQDLDLDGAPDLVTLNGHINDRVEQTDPGTGSTYRQRPSLHRNDGTGRFQDAAGGAGAFFAAAVVGRGLACADLDGDSDPDLAAVTLDRSVVVLRNDTGAGSRAISLRLVGRRSARSAHGAWIEVDCGGVRRTFDYNSARSYLSASAPEVLVGLGKNPCAEKVQIHWPSGARSILNDVRPGARLVVEEPRD